MRFRLLLLLIILNTITKATTISNKDGNNNEQEIMNKNSSSNASSYKAKTIYLIRHAESEENRRLGSLKSIFKGLTSFALPKTDDVMASLELINIPAQIDSDVSPVGQEQINKMAKILRSENFIKEKDITWVLHSPLERAKQTSLGLLQCMVDDDDDDNNNNIIISSNNDNINNNSHNNQQKIHKHEHVQKVQESKLLFEQTPTEWVATSTLWKRIYELEKILYEQNDHENIAIVGHSQYFRNMLHLDFKFDNCDVWQVTLDLSKKKLHCGDTSDPTFPSNNDDDVVDDIDVEPSIKDLCALSPTISPMKSKAPNDGNGNSKNNGDYEHYLPPQWYGLKKLYSCNQEKIITNTTQEREQSGGNN